MSLSPSLSLSLRSLPAYCASSLALLVDPHLLLQHVECAGVRRDLNYWVNCPPVSPAAWQCCCNACQMLLSAA